MGSWEYSSYLQAVKRFEDSPELKAILDDISGVGILRDGEFGQDVLIISYRLFSHHEG